MIEAFAHPNVALVKYWGKRHEALRIPATPSLSIPLLGFATRTRIEILKSERDEVFIEGKQDGSARVEHWLASLRSVHGLEIPPLRVDSSSDFPASAGLASSASGYAALAKGINQLLKLGLGYEALSLLARLGSASAARSVKDGFITLEGEGADHQSWCAREVASWESWPLGVCVALCSPSAKQVSSSEGMRIGQDTSPSYADWTDMNERLFQTAKQAIERKDFDALAWASRWSFFGMLSVMTSSRPPLTYLNETSFAVISAIEELRKQGAAVFFTCDAGAQVKCVYLPDYEPLVLSRLQTIPGVLNVLRVSPP